MHLGVGTGEGRKRGKRGVEFPGCAAWWTRSPMDWPGRAPEGLHGRPLSVYVAEQRYFLENGALGLGDALPGRLHDCIATLASQENVRDTLAREDTLAKARRKGAQV